MLQDWKRRTKGNKGQWRSLSRERFDLSANGPSVTSRGGLRYLVAGWNDTPVLPSYPLQFCVLCVCSFVLLVAMPHHGVRLSVDNRACDEWHMLYARFPRGLNVYQGS